jgi:dephospho-CoA kinase
MIVVGLTGSIGMGKSTTAQMFAEAGAPVYDADAEVRRLYAPGGAAAPLIEAAFPGVVRGGGVDRGLLAERVAADGGRAGGLLRARQGGERRRRGAGHPPAVGNRR